LRERSYYLTRRKKGRAYGGKRKEGTSPGPPPRKSLKPPARKVTKLQVVGNALCRRGGEMKWDFVGKEKMGERGKTWAAEKQDHEKIGSAGSSVNRSSKTS